MNNFILPQNNSPNKLLSNVPQFTCDLPKFMRYVIRTQENTPIDILDAEIISKLDPKEEYCHVQFLDRNNNKMERPLLWYIKAWKSDYLKWKLDKERADRERKEANIFKENVELVIKACMKSTGINDPDVFRGLAINIAKTKKQDNEATKALKIKLDSIDQY